MKSKFIIAILLISRIATAQSTDDYSDLSDMLGAPTEEKAFISSTFKATRVVNRHSIENTGKGILDFRIEHRFGRIDGSLGEFFGLDGANTMLALDYGVTDRLAVGLSRSGYQKEIEGYGKYKLLWQTSDGSMPVSMSYLGVMSVTTMAAPTYVGDRDYPFSRRLFFVNQLIIARKFSNKFSAQLSPTHVHYNIVDYSNEQNDLFSLGSAISYKVSKRVALNAEYFLQMPGRKLDMTQNAFSIGCDVETGGHVFQLHFTNATAMTQRMFITQTNDKWLSGIHFGFNISRVFTVVKPKGLESLRNSIY